MSERHRTEESSQPQKAHERDRDKQAREKGQDPRESGRTPDTEPPKEKRIDDL